MRREGGKVVAEVRIMEVGGKEVREGIEGRILASLLVD